MQWFYAENGQQAGPVEDAVLAAMARDGRIDPTTLVWNAGMANWEPYGAVAARMAGGVAAPAEPGQPLGAATGETAACTECGRSFPQEDMVQYSGAFVCAACKPAFFQKIREGVHVGAEMRYAGFWIRFAAKIIDGILLLIVTMPLGILLGAGSSVAASGRNPFLHMYSLAGFTTLSGLLNLAIAIAYYVYFHGRSGQTLGKMACGIRVVRSDGSKITNARALGRYFGDMLSGMILYIGYIMAGVDIERRALHDRICDTRVVYGAAPK